MYILDVMDIYFDYVPDDITDAVEAINYLHASGEKQKIDELIAQEITRENIKLIMSGGALRGRKPIEIENTAFDIVMLAMDPDDDIYTPSLNGIYRSVAMSFDKQNEKQQRTTIAAGKLKILMHNKKITTKLIQSRLNIGKAQASRYMTAVKACIPLIEMKRGK